MTHRIAQDVCATLLLVILGLSLPLSTQLGKTLVHLASDIAGSDIAAQHH